MGIGASIKLIQVGTGWANEFNLYKKPKKIGKLKIPFDIFILFIG